MRLNFKAVMNIDYVIFALIFIQWSSTYALKIYKYEKNTEREPYETSIKTYITRPIIDWNNVYESFKQFRRGLKICSLTRKQVIYLCRVILESDVYKLTVDRTVYQRTGCEKIKFVFKLIENLKNKDKQYMKMAECPPIVNSKAAYFLSSTGHEVPSLNVFERLGPFGFPIYPSAYVTKIDTEELKEVRKWEKKQIRDIQKRFIVDRSNIPLAVAEKPLPQLPDSLFATHS